MNPKTKYKWVWYVAAAVVAWFGWKNWDKIKAMFNK